MVDYVNSFTQLGAELRNRRKIEALYEHSHFSFDANHSQRLINAAYSDAVDEEAVAQAIATFGLENDITSATRSLAKTQKELLESSFFPVLDVELATSATDKAAGAIEYIYDDSLTNGQIAIKERRGRLGALRRSMIADSQTIQANTPTFGTFTALSGNVGSLVVGSMTGSDHTLSGTAIFEVTDETVDRPLLSVTLSLSRQLADETVSITNTGGKNLAVGQSYQDGDTGLTITLNLDSITETGDDGNMFSSPIISTPAEADSNKGKIFVRVTRQAVAPIWLIEWFKDSALTGLVASTTADTVVGTVALDMTGGSGMRFQVTFDRAAANVKLPAAGNADSDITFDIRSPRIGDRWTRSVTNNEAGSFATKIAKIYRASLNSTAAAPTISDALASSISIS